MTTTRKLAFFAVPVVAAAVAAGAIASQSAPAPTGPMLTIAQAVAIAEDTQHGTVYSVRRGSDRGDVVYHVKVSTADRGRVDVHVLAFGGRVMPQDDDER